MSAEEFAARVVKLITDARDEGLSDDDMIAELSGILDAMHDNA